MAEPWQLTLLGGLRAERGGRTITRFKYHKVGGLLAYLAYHPQHMHAREVLIELFWPESEPEAGRGNLSVALSSLRNQFEPPGTPASTVFKADRYSIGVHHAALHIDTAEFERAITMAAILPLRSPDRAAHLQRAVDLYRGPLLPGFYEEWIPAEQERLAGLFLDATTALIAYRQESGDLTEALRLARRAVAVEPLREESSQHLMRLLAASGQPGAALRQYKELERRLEGELGQEPSASVRALYRGIERASGLTDPVVLFTPSVHAAGFTLSREAVPPDAPQTRTFLLADIEGAAELQKQAQSGFMEALQTYRRLLRHVFVAHGGKEAGEAGGRLVASFGSASKAALCAVAAQQTLLEQEWPKATGLLKIRMSLLTGEVEAGDDGAEANPVLRQAIQLLAASHGGQILVGEVAAGLLRARLPAETRLLDLGLFRLPNAPAPERLYQIEYPGMPQEPFAPPAAEPGHSGNLPFTSTRFFGRHHEIARLQEWLTPAGKRSCLVTLTGLGGVGKTRLALAVAERLMEVYQSRVWFVPLADLWDPALIDDAILDALHLPRSPQREARDQVVEFLSHQPCLLVLDNFEHLVEVGTEAVQALLAHVPALCLLVTSRRLLGLPAEQEFDVPLLPTPNGPDTPEHLSLFESAQLFIDRAQQVMPHFQVTNQNAAAVAELCDRLEGIPLAIELAAARAQVMTPFQILAQLENRFEFLTSRKRGVEERHRTLRAAVEWSIRLLSPEVQRFFARLSVFRGGWTVEAAEAVCEAEGPEGVGPSPGMALDYLAQLRECSLVLTEERESSMRFRMLDTLQEYGQEQLSAPERDELCRRHSAFFKGFAANATVNLCTGQDQARYLEPFAAEQDNLRTGLDWWITQGDAARAQQFAEELVHYWGRAGHWREGQHWIARILRLPEAQTRASLRARLLTWAGSLAFGEESDEARLHLHEAVSIAREVEDVDVLLESLHWLGIVEEGRGEYHVSLAMQAEGMALARQQGKRMEEALLIRVAARSYMALGELEKAGSLLEESLRFWESANNERGISMVRYELTRLAILQGDLERAGAQGERQLLLARKLKDRLHLALGLGNRARIAFLHRAYAEAELLCHESLPFCLDIGARWESCWVLRLQGYIALAQGKVERAARCLSAAERLRAAIGEILTPVEKQEYEAAQVSVRTGMGEEAFTAAWEAGRAMTWEEAVAYALSGGVGLNMISGEE